MEEVSQGARRTADSPPGRGWVGAGVEVGIDRSAGLVVGPRICSPSVPSYHLVLPTEDDRIVLAVR